MTFKSLAAAALLAAGSNASMAALLADGFTPGTPSSVLVAVYDNSSGLAKSGATVLYNTKISYGDFVNGLVSGKTIDLSSDPNFQALNASGANLVYNIVGGYSLADDFSNYDKTGSSGKIFSDKANTQWGVVTTGTKATDFTGDFVSLGDTTKNRIYAYWFAANLKLTALGATKTGGPDSVLVPAGDPQASYNLAWGGNFGGGGIALNAKANSGPVGQALKFFWVTNTDFGKGSVVEIGNWTLSGAGKLVYSPNGGGGGGGSGNPPIAKTGSDQTAAKGTLVTLDGSGSSDPNGLPLTYSWAQTSGPQATLTNATSAKATFTPSTDGVYVFTLTVNDGKLSASATTKVTVATSSPIKLDAPASWKVGAKQTIRFTAPTLDQKSPVTVSFAKDGVSFVKIGVSTLKKGAYVWKPSKTQVTTKGALKATATVGTGSAKKSVESAPLSISVNP